MIIILPVIKMNNINYYSGRIKISITILYYLIFLLFLIYIYKIYSFNFLINFIIADTAVFLPLVLLKNGFDTISAPKAEYLYTFTVVVCILCILKKINFIHSYNDEKKSAIDKIVYVFIAIYFILLLLSTINSISIRRSLFGRIFWNEGFFALSCYLILFIAASKYFEFSKLYIYVLTAAASIVSIIGIAQFYGYDLLGGKNGFEVYATIGQHDMVGSYTVMVLPIVVFAYLYCKKTYRHLYFAAACLIYLCMLCSFARSAWVAFCMVCILSVYLVFKYKRKVIKKYFVILSAFVIITAVFNFTSNNRMLNRAHSISVDFNNLVTESENYKSAGSQRIYIWEKALGIIPYKPVFGSGPDTFDLEVKRVYGYYIYDGGIDRTAVGSIVTRAHNEYLQIAAALGIPALICYILFLISIFYKAFKGLKFNKLLIPLVCAVAGYLVQAFFNNSVIGVASLFWIFIGVMYKMSFIKVGNDK